MLPENMRLLKLINAVDKVFTFFPSLSYRVIMVTLKRKESCK